jgi:methionyl-tRNA formyltransferase
MNKKYSVIFFGSFGKYSVIVLDKLLTSGIYHLASVITTPPAPKGRHLKLAKTEVQLYAESHNIPVFTPSDLQVHPSEALMIPKGEGGPDFIVVAGYGKLLPPAWLNLPKIMPVNLHPSLLPAYPGRCPAEWAILRGEKETGVTLIQMTEKFDAGPILAQEKLSISPDDTRLTLYDKLFSLGADLLINTLPQIASHPQTLNSQLSTINSFYARQITREDGFIPWEEYQSQITNHKSQLFTKYRAFAGWPGVWTLDPNGNRIIFRLHHP